MADGADAGDGAALRQARGERDEGLEAEVERRVAEATAPHLARVAELKAEAAQVRHEHVTCGFARSEAAAPHA